MESNSLLNKLFTNEKHHGSGKWHGPLWLSLALVSLMAAAWKANYQERGRTGVANIQAAVLFLGAAVCFYFFWIGSAKQGWLRAAKRLAFRYKVQGSKDDLLLLPCLALWEGNPQSQVSQILGGCRDGLETLVFQWECETMEGLREPTTVTLFAHTKSPIPTFRLTPRTVVPTAEGFFPRSAGTLDLGRGRNETFSQNYLIESGEEEKVATLFDQRLQAYFAQNPTWTVESCDGWLAVYRVGQRLEPSQVEDRLNKAVEILRLFVDNAAG